MARPVAEDDKITIPASIVVELLGAMKEARIRFEKVGTSIYGFLPEAPILGTIAEAERYLRLHANFISETTGLNEEGWIDECQSSDSQTNLKKKPAQETRNKKRSTSRRA